MSSETSDFVTGHFTTVDYVIFILLIVVSVVIGFVVGIRGWKKSTTKDFLVGGRKMHPVPVTLSLIGGVISALSVLGNPTEMYRNGTQLWMILIGNFFGILGVLFIVLPTLYPLELISIVQYIELRFQWPFLKKLCSLTQMAFIATYLGICLYAPSLALSSVTSLSSEVSSVILGLVCTLYISVGGVKAVVYTDVIQTLMMFIGILAVIIVVCIDLGGVGPVFDIASRGGRIEFFNLDPSPFVRHTLWSVQIFGVYFILSQVGFSQSQFQRLNSVRTLGMAQRICAAFYVGLVVLWSLFNFTGLVAYAAYSECDPLASKQIEKPDQIVPFLVADKLRRFPGMAGLFVAAVYGAVLSSVSSQASAFAALVWEDFLSDWVWFRKTVPISATNVTRILSATAGLIGLSLAFAVANLGTILQLAFSVSSAVIGPLDGLFFTAITAPWVNAKGALSGFITAVSFNMWLLVGQLMNKAGQVQPLPVSTSGCPAFINSFSNMTEITIFTVEETSIMSTEELEKSTERDYLHIYDISYCYMGVIGVLIVFIVSSLVSLVTGPNSPDDVDEKLVHKGSLKLYRWFWKILTRRKKLEISKNNNSFRSDYKTPIHNFSELEIDQEKL